MSRMNPSDNPVYRAERHRKRREQAIRYLGGKCADCDNSMENASMDIFEFHHKQGGDSTGNRINFNRAWDTVAAQLDGVILVCANCHRVRTAKENKPYRVVNNGEAA